MDDGLSRMAALDLGTDNVLAVEGLEGSQACLDAHQLGRVHEIRPARALGEELLALGDVDRDALYLHSQLRNRRVVSGRLMVVLNEPEEPSALVEPNT